MNLTKAVTDNAPAVLDDIDLRIAALLREMRELHVKRVQVVMHMVVASFDAPVASAAVTIE